ncbi:MAG TPA: hypothetical protein VLH39_02455 [Magnetospirillaceae bacterium]|nr:hypothetical protein [Magnetospirillaceae bacterium]
MRSSFAIGAILGILLTSCAGIPEDRSAPAHDPALAELAAPLPDPPAFDPALITAEIKRDTMEEVKAFIEKLNRIIQGKDYAAWKTHLMPEYISFYSNPEVLAGMSESQVLRRQGIRLKSLQDFFLHVVYPSRQRVRVDDIEFSSSLRVRAVTVAPSGDRRVFYYLEKSGESWKISTGR